MRYKVSVYYMDKGEEKHTTKFVDANSSEEAGRLVRQQFYRSRIDSIDLTNSDEEHNYYKNKLNSQITGCIIYIIIGIIILAYFQNR